MEMGERNMKLKPNETVITAFSKHFKRIFGGNTTYGDIAKVKKTTKPNFIIIKDDKYFYGKGLDSILKKLKSGFYKKNGSKALDDLRKLDKTYPSQNSDNLMGNHVAEYLKDQSDFINKNKES